MQSPTLTEEQERVRDAVVARGLSCFLTGSAGTGKSYLTGALIRDLQAKFGREKVAVTATTGVAACHIRGATLHSFAGIGTGEGAPELLIAKVRRDTKAAKRWREVCCLVIDEVSMLDGRLFDKLHAVACALRPKQAHRPFGGVQLLLVGDFYQLPPVCRGSEGEGGGARFAFEADIWPRAVAAQFELHTVFRQAGDTEFIDLLNTIRAGACTPAIAHRLTQTKDNALDDGDVRPTKLFCKNVDVDAINSQEVAALPGDLLRFVAQDWGARPHLKDAIAKSCMAPAELALKEGAQVVLLKNLDVESGLSNGTLGVFVGIAPTGDALLVRFATIHGVRAHAVKQERFTMEVGGEAIASRIQYPLRLAYASTIHRSQGLTLARAEMSLKDVFEYSQAYVALSRVQSLSGLRVLSFCPAAVRCHPKVLAFYAKLRTAAAAEGGDASSSGACKRATKRPRSEPQQ